VRSELQEIKAALLEVRASVAALRFENAEFRRRLTQEATKPPAP
jgi:regulator of replication initiation timing